MLFVHTLYKIHIIDKNDRLWWQMMKNMATSAVPGVYVSSVTLRSLNTT